MRYTIVSACSKATLRSAACPRRPRERHRQGGQRGQDAIAERSADPRRMRVGFDERSRSDGETYRRRRRPARRPERRDALRSRSSSALEIELDRRTRPRSSAVDDTDRPAVADRRPTSRARRGRTRTARRQRAMRGFGPGNDDQNDTRRRQRGDQSVFARLRRRAIVAEQLQQRDDGHVEDARAGSTRARATVTPVATSGRGAVRTPARPGRDRSPAARVPRRRRARSILR